MTRFFPLERLRNVGIIAHVDAGKTTLSERLLYLGGRIHRIGAVHDGEATLDHLPQEQDKGITITAAATSIPWGDHRVDLIDTPGHIDFGIEVERSLRVLDGAVVVLDGSRGVEPQSETVWRQADRYGVPRLVFVNKLDKLGASFEASVESLKTRLFARPLVISMPIGEGSELSGIIDLVGMRALRFDEADRGRVPRVEPIPASLLSAAEEAHERLVELASEADDAVLAAWVSGGSRAVSAEALERAIRQGTLDRRFVPVLAGSAHAHQGVSSLLDAIVRFLPSPLWRAKVSGTDPDSGEELVRETRPEAPLVALAFKVTNNPFIGTLTWLRLYAGTLEKGQAVLDVARRRTIRVGRILRLHAGKGEEIDAAEAGEIVAVQGLREVRTGDTLSDPDAPLMLERLVVPPPVAEATLEAKAAADVDRLSIAVGRLVAEDPSLSAGTDPETGLVILRGRGELHLEIAADRLRTEHGVEARLGRPSVAYRSTFAKPVTVVERLKAQNGGPGMFAVVELSVEPSARGTGLRFIDATHGGAVPKTLVSAVEKGVRATLESGAGGTWPVVDVTVTLKDGEVHKKDSTAPAFERAASMAMRTAAEESGLLLLEPWMAVAVSTPEGTLGDVLGDLMARRGVVRKTALEQGLAEVEAEAPLSELFGYASDLRGKTRGRGSAALAFSGYLEAPG
ncbi:MAG: elongation factor G [Myxococcota bacterium]